MRHTGSVLVIMLGLLCCPALATEDAAGDMQALPGLRQEPSDDLTDAVTIPRMLSYQGKLTDTLGIPVPDDDYPVLFRLYTQASGGSSFWSETQNVRTQSGLFSALLGSVTPIGSVPDAGTAYLGMSVSGGAELTPRLRIASAAYAFLSERAADADLLQGRDTVYYNARFVNENQVNSVTGPMLVNGAVTTAKIFDGEVNNADLAPGAVTGDKVNQMGAATGQVIKWTGTTWAPRNDSVGGGGGGSVTSVSQGTGVNCTPNPITTTGTVGLNTGYTDGRYVNVTGDSMTGRLAVGAQLRTYDKAALGYSCYNNGFAAFCAGYGNSAGGDRSSITGGEDNSTSGKYSHVGGGSENYTSGLWSFIGGGNVNEADDSAATISGGRENWATAPYTVVGGGQNNVASMRGAAVGGGVMNRADSGYATVGGGEGNRAGGVHSAICGGSSNTTSGASAAIGGGFGNDAGTGAAVAGGQNNDATGSCATIGGGQSNNATEFCASVIGGQGNDALGSFSVILGGRANYARGYLSLAAGTHAHSNHHGCFVWGDSTQSLSDSVYTTGSNQFRVRARGGTWFFSNQAKTTGAYLAAGSNSWASACDSATKEDFREVDRQELLDKVAALRVRNYKMKDQDDGTRHIGPVAQDFAAAFGYGESDKSINMADADGVLLAAVQALYEQNQVQQAEIEALKAELAKTK